MVFQEMEGFGLETVRRRLPAIETSSSFTPAGPAADLRGRTLLHLSAMSGDSHACRSLLAAGADPCQLDASGRTAADLARSAGHFDLAAALVGRIETGDEIAARAPLTTRELIGLARDDAKIMEEMIARKRLSARDAKGDTPLHIAAMRGKMQLADLFVRSGADIHATNAEGMTPSEAASANGFALLAGLLAAAAGLKPVEQKPQVIPVARMQSVATESPTKVAEPSAAHLQDVSAMDMDLGELDGLAFEGEVEAEQFHEHLEHGETRGSFQRLSSDVKILSGFAEAQIDWDIGLVRGSVEGDGISSVGQTVLAEDHQPALVGRRELRRPAQPSTWRRFWIDPGDCRAIVEHVFETGTLSHQDIEEILGLCDGRFDPVDLRLNIEREFEAAGFHYPDDQSCAWWDVLSPVDIDDLNDAIVATCTRTAILPGATEDVPGKKAMLRLTAKLVDARRAMLLGLVETPRAVDIIIYMADLVAKGEVAPDDMSALTFETGHPSKEGQQFLEAVSTLRERRDDIAMGSRRAIRAAADAAELLELRTEFLRDVATAMSGSTALRHVADKLDRDLDVLEACSDAILNDFIPLCRRFAAQNATDDEDQEDLFQVAFLGLRRAVIRFKPELGTNFAAYVSMCLRQSVERWRADEGRLIRLPVQRQAILAECRKAADAIEARCLREATTIEIVAELNRQPELAALLERIPLHPVGLDQLDDQAAEGMDGDMPESMWLADVVRLINDELGQLRDRQADVICRRFGIGFDDEMTLEEVGQIYGVTRERIRQIEAKALTALSHPARKRYLSKAL